jgi:arginine decarboxylase
VLPTPTKFSVVAGSAEGPTRLNAFDNALLAAGIGNLNLLRVSSILPPKAQEVPAFAMPAGSLVPCAYGTITSEEPGAVISAAVAVGISRADEYGVIMEFSGHCTREEAKQRVEHMARQALKSRERAVERVIVHAVEHRVQEIGCAFAAVALWY